MSLAQRDAERVTFWPNEGRVDTIRLIDVHQRSIQEIYNVQLAELKFIALSYVWGSAPMERLLKKNKTALQKPGSFTSSDCRKRLLTVWSWWTSLGSNTSGLMRSV